MSSPDLSEAEREAVSQLLHGQVLSLGPKLEDFEKLLTRYLGVKHAIGVSSGTAGLHLAVIVAGITDGDLVITSPFSFIASANCLLYERANPIFVDVNPATGNIDPALVAEAAWDLKHGGAKTRRWLPPALATRNYETVGRLKALLPVHAFGQPAEMDALLDTARAYKLVIIEDACEAIGSEFRGCKAGTLGQVAVFAFYPNKQITSGEGGMIVTDNADWDCLCRSLRNQGRDVFGTWLNHTRLGYNYRLDEMSAVLGMTQLQRIEELLQKRGQVAAWYQERLHGIEGIETPCLAPDTSRMSWFVYVIRVIPPLSRNRLIQRLAAENIPTRPYFTPIHLQPVYQERFGYRRGNFPMTEYLGDVSLALPFSGVMTEAQVDYVCDRLRKQLGAVPSLRPHIKRATTAVSPATQISPRTRA